MVSAPCLNHAEEKVIIVYHLAALRLHYSSFPFPRPLAYPTRPSSTLAGFSKALMFTSLSTEFGQEKMIQLKSIEFELVQNQFTGANIMFYGREYPPLWHRHFLASAMSLLLLMHQDRAQP